jgi:hypothetical protein
MALALVRAMENTNRLKEVVVEFFLSGASLSEPLTRELVRHDSLSVDLIRARISASDAWIRLRLSGTSAAIDAFVRRHQDKFVVLYPAVEAVA